MITKNISLKDGDIYFWSFKEVDLDRGYEFTYWCKSRKAVVWDGRIIDTYWNTLGSDDYIVHPNEVNLEYQGNTNEMTVIDRWETEYYTPDNIVSMAHPNNSGGPIYLKPGSKKNVKVMTEYLKRKIDEANSEIRSRTREIQRVKDKLILLGNGKIDEVHL